MVLMVRDFDEHADNDNSERVAGEDDGTDGEEYRQNLACRGGSGPIEGGYLEHRGADGWDSGGSYVKFGVGAER